MNTDTRPAPWVTDTMMECDSCRMGAITFSDPALLCSNCGEMWQERHRGKDTDLGHMVMLADVYWLKGVADLATRLAGPMVMH